MFSARARKTAPEAGALPINFGIQVLQTLENFERLFRAAGCRPPRQPGWLPLQLRCWRPIYAGRTRTVPPMHDAASAWNAGFIRQVCNRRVLLPDKSGVPVVVSRACCPNCRAGFRACRLRSFPTSRTKADSLTRNPGTGKSPEPADRNVCPTSEAEIDLGKTPSRCTRQKSPL